MEFSDGSRRATMTVVRLDAARWARQVRSEQRRTAAASSASTSASASASASKASEASAHEPSHEGASGKGERSVSPAQHSLDELREQAEREAGTVLELTLARAAQGDAVASGSLSASVVLRLMPPDGEPVAAFVAAVPPGPALIAVLECVAARALSADDRVEVVRGWERAGAWLAARQARALAAAAEAAAVELAPQPGSPAAEHWSGEQAGEAEIGAAVRWSQPTVANRIHLAGELTGRCVPTLDELEAGRLEPRQAAAVVEACGPLGDAAAAQVQQRVLGRAGKQTVAQLRRSLRRAVIAADPSTAAERQAAARAERDVALTTLPDGMAQVALTTDAAGAQTVWAALDAVAAHLPAVDPEGRPVPVAARRADGLVALCAAVLGDPDVLPGLAHAATQRPAVRVTVSLDTLLGLSERPGELDGYGPIPAPMARELAADGTWRRWTLEPQTGQLLDVGSCTYRPSARLAAFVTARDRTCRGPGSGYPADRADLDHVAEFDGANTTRANLQPLRRRWHNAKTHGGWRPTRAPDGTVTWRTPLGRRYVIPPEDLDPE
ncbi:DUF222 domain-containing protein [Motilibacter deserti]|uniref:DUF222 domain-containing protein n=1 Tax=Motilibacter deserti TaxID=2714956 RepID=A0ABX0GUT4_9ACTN|nr:DUF222 domain-containing protein [Motilibacter deserti]NHC14682.1 DUF222 domain-containing protein [Motilibacter deserti]